MLSPAEPTATDLRELRYIQHFSVWALRTSVACSPTCRILLREFDRAFAGDIEQGLASYHAFIRHLGQGRRKISIGRPGHVELTHDEQSLLALLAAAQTGDHERFLAHARFFMGHNRLDDLYDSARDFTGRLRAKGHFFSKPLMVDLEDATFQAGLSATG
jgi:hypothetical protein